MRTIRMTGAIGAAAVLALSATSVFAAEGPVRVTNIPTSIVEGAPDLLISENAELVRSEDGLGVTIKLMTPEAGGYRYPETIPAEQQAQPEVFTGWMFVFNHPEHCTTNAGTDIPCGADDFNDKVKFGAYNFGGFVNALSQTSGGPIEVNVATDGLVMLDGAVELGQANHSGPPGAETFALENPMGAEVHVAIAPHGQFDAETIATELFSPVGNPTCECWWVATFVAGT